MALIKKIAVAVDISPQSEETLRYAAVLAEGVGAELVIINVINQRDLDALKYVAQTGYEMDVEKWKAEQKAYRQGEIEKYMEAAGCGGVQAKIIFKIGVPYVEIIDTAKAEGADMIVMGTKGRTALSDTLLGSAAQKVFRRAHIPVLSVRGQEHEALVCRLKDE